MGFTINPLKNIEEREFLLSNFHPQYTNAFQIIFTPTYIEYTNPITVAYDAVIAQYFIKSLDIPFTSIEYDKTPYEKYPKGIVHPDTCTISFIENTETMVRSFLTNWQRDIVSESLEMNYQNLKFFVNYRFKDNQLKSKKNAIILPIGDKGLPNASFILLGGLKIQSIANVPFDQSSGDPMILEATFSLDTSWWVTAGTVISKLPLPTLPS